jgi:cytoskeletal protein RodZ
MAESFGPILAKARAERGESLEQISRVLHLRPVYLQALEEEDYAALPSDVQGKGYLRMYAAHLGLPAQPLLETWGKKIKHKAGDPLPQPVAVETIEAPELQPVEDEVQTELEEPTPPEIESMGFDTIEPPDEPEPRPKEEVPAPKSADLFVQIGEKLHQQREALNLSLADVERHTHVRLHYLEAIEDGRIDDLPSPVQGRGMINNYASFLELDPDAMLSTFAEGLQARRLETHAPMPSTRKKGAPARRATIKPPSAVRRLITPDLILGTILITVLFGFGVWAATRVTAVQDQPAVPTPPSIADVLLQTSTPAALVAVTSTPIANLATLLPDNSGGSAAQSSPTAVQATITLPAAGTGALQLAIVAQMSTYMRVTVDGKVTFDGRAIAGNAYPFSGDTRIELLIGNAAGLQVFFNQNDLGNLGLVGQVKTLIFTKGAVVTPTPQFTPTSSPTPTTTVTPHPSQTLPAPSITPFVP